MIEVKNLVKDYGGHIAVDHLNFTVEDGQIYGFLGPNGAGKSTTMNIITGYLGATEGEVWIDGHNILDEPEKAKKNIGYLPEVPPLYIEMTVDEYLNFAAELKKIPAGTRREATAEAKKLAGLNGVEKRLIRNLSKGYRQRVGLAQAVLGMPDVIILDEPTVGLDPKQIIEIRDVIRSLGKNHTVILSSHILSEVSAVCDHILIISHGRLIASDTPENLEKKMTGEKMLELLVRGSAEAVGEVLDLAVPGREYHLEAEEDGSVRVSLELAEDVREPLFFAFADQRLPILAMNLQRASLEEVFLELTGEQGKEEERHEGDL